MATSREFMVKALRKTVVPQLRAMGFRGSFPHFRRSGSQQIDLLTFQFDKWGGGFVVEIAKCPVEGVIHPWGIIAGPTRVKVWDVHPGDRLRLQPRLGSSTGDWFRYDQQVRSEEDSELEDIARQVIPYLEIAEIWWRGEDHEYIRAYETHFRKSK
jgi:hypothetical protein